ncbi:28782_t:CDS:2 [Dentiscutata erythropus]|uniref:28782_t:CDS:1 n=1 Tax=Dentiscutata erythropus TaxID=1348616 RepID=A0A9N8W415_9GLOM|nr:28782_t:CDS:2 [Dentiscutata erythropus]
MNLDFNDMGLDYGLGSIARGHNPTVNNPDKQNPEIPKSWNSTNLNKFQKVCSNRLDSVK